MNLIGFRHNLNSAYAVTKKAKRARMEGVSLKALLLSAALYVPLGLSAASAEDSRVNSAAYAGNTGDYASAEQSQPSSALTVFNRRWSSEKQEFSVGANGVVTREISQPDSYENGSQFGNIEKPVAGSGSINEIANMAMSNPKVSDDIGNTFDGSLGNNSVKECGPSPLSPEEIKALVHQAARRHQVDVLFATAIVWAESQFDRSRNSDKGARGPMQLMPETAVRFGVNNICDPKENIEGGIKYLRVLLDEFQNPLLVAAAYNAGEGRIYEYGGVPPFKETVGYVAKVVNYQLGVTIPSKKRAVSASKKSAPSPTIQAESGIITVKKTGTFVGGVMHF